MVRMMNQTEYMQKCVFTHGNDMKPKYGCNHHKRVNKREKEMGVGRHTQYYIFALMQEGPKKYPN